MRVGLDARFLTHPQLGGFKSYLHGLVEGLARIKTAIRFVLYVDRPLTPELAPLASYFDVRVVEGRAPLVGLPWREQVLLPLALRRNRVDVFHAPCHTAPLWLHAPLVVTVHDMLWRNRSRAAAYDVHRAALESYYDVMTNCAVRTARVVLTVSETSRRAICNDLPFLRNDDVVAVPNAPKSCFRPITAFEARAVTAQFNLPPQYILGQASADPRKNLPSLIRAFAQLPSSIRTQFPLVVIWAHQDLAPTARALSEELRVSSQVHFLHSVDDRALAAIFSMASVFVFPSLAEGFGMPALEAMACGAPVIANNHAAIVETTADAAWIVDARNIGELAGAIERLLSDERCRQSLVERGSARARLFTWEACARRTIAAYEKAATDDPHLQRRL